jgi:site-specific recombinase XerD
LLNSVALGVFRSLLPNMATSNIVFLSQDGHSAMRNNKHWFGKALNEAGIRDFTLRHTFASRLVMADVNLLTVKELMGHKTINITCRYAHLAPSHQFATVEKIANSTPQPSDRASASTQG